MRRLDVLKKSLEKKQAEFDKKLQEHFDTAAQTNGQPLNDKRNGRAVMNKQERQNDSLRRLDASIEATKKAVENEAAEIAHVEKITNMLPDPIVDRIKHGRLRQWRKYPHIFFVSGIDKARIIFDLKTRKLAHKHANTISDREQRLKFADVYNDLSEALNLSLKTEKR